MFVENVIIGRNPPVDVNVVIEISMNNASPVKYEFDGEIGALVVDRIMQVAMFYPCNYGFVPHTLSGDGDPVDVLVISNCPIMPGAVINCRPVGVLMMEDESGQDEKIIAVPSDKVDVSMKNILSINDVNSVLLDRIRHFFESYKTIDEGKWVRVHGYQDVDVALDIIAQAIERCDKSSDRNCE
jgi:inorganic pyrophosphatase